jgi:hypothetical protein
MFTKGNRLPKTTMNSGITGKTPTRKPLNCWLIHQEDAENISDCVNELCVTENYSR